LGKAYFLWGEPIRTIELYKKIIDDSLISKNSKKYKEIENFNKTLANVQNSLKVLSEEIYITQKQINIPNRKQLSIVDAKKALSVIENFNKDYRNYIEILYKYYVEERKEESESQILSFIEHLPPIPECYKSFYKIAKLNRNYKLISYISDQFSKLIQTRDYPNDVWICANEISAKNMVCDPNNQHFDEAKSILQQLAQILPPLPIENETDYSLFDFAMQPTATANNMGALNTILEEPNSSTNHEFQQSDLSPFEELAENGENAENPESLENQDNGPNLRVSVLEFEEPQNEKAKPSQANIPEPVRPPMIKVPNPQLDYIKNIHHAKKSSAFQEHMTIQMEVEKNSQFAMKHKASPSGRQRVFFLQFLQYLKSQQNRHWFHRNC